MTLLCTAKCTKVIKKSQSDAFKKLEMGDIINFSVEIEPSGRSNNGTYATYIECYNPKTEGLSMLSFNQIGRILRCFEFEQLPEEE